MRAIYKKDLTDLSDEFIIDDDKFHHLANVVRIKEDEEILLLNGKGSKRLARIVSIDKKKINLVFISDIEFEKPVHNLHFGLSFLKRDALELSLKQLIELGVTKIYIVTTQYSQNHKIKKDRLSKILISSLEQSNSMYLPQVEFVDLSRLINLYERIIYFSPYGDNYLNLKIPEKDTALILVGPEGGMSEKEELDLSHKTQRVKMMTNILRASTATSACMGYCLAKLVKTD